MFSHISNDIIKLVKNREKNWTKTNIRKQCYGREIKEEKEMIKEDKRRQPQNQALCVHSYESKYKLDSNSKFRKSRPKANEKHLFHDFEYCKRHSKYKASTTTPHVSISRWRQFGTIAPYFVSGGILVGWVHFTLKSVGSIPPVTVPNPDQPPLAIY